VEGLLGLARRWVRDDPDVAVRAARALLRLKPGDERATGLLDEAGAGDGGTWTAIFDGRDLSGFPGHDPEKVQLADGILVAEIKQAAFLTLAQKNFEGDYDLRMEMRIAKTHSPKYVAVMLAGHSAAYVYTQVGVWLDDAVLREVDGQGKEESRFPFRKPLSEITPKIDPSTWNTYELQFRDGRVRFLVNGNLLTEQERAANREAGRAGIQFQDVRMEIRRFQYRQR
jgi:hypothetical protein